MAERLPDDIARLRAQAIAIATAAAPGEAARANIREFGAVVDDVVKSRADSPRALAALAERCRSDDPLEQPTSAWEIVHSLDGIAMSVGGRDPESAAPPSIGKNITLWTLVAMAVFAAIAWFVMSR